MENFVLNTLERCRYCNFISSDVVEENPSFKLAIMLSLERAAPKEQLESNAFSTLTVGKNLVSGNKAFNFIVQGDGNIVLYKKGAAKWSTGTRGTNCKLVLQGDANLVLYCDEGVRWSTNTSRFASQGPFKFVVQNDGNLVLYTATNGVAWASNTSGVVTLDQAEDMENDSENYRGDTLDERTQSNEEEEF
jgi:hypothetical protein